MVVVGGGGGGGGGIVTTYAHTPASISSVHEFGRQLVVTIQYLTRSPHLVC